MTRSIFTLALLATAACGGEAFTIADPPLDGDASDVLQPLPDAAQDAERDARGSTLDGGADADALPSADATADSPQDASADVTCAKMPVFVYTCGGRSITAPLRVCAIDNGSAWDQPTPAPCQCVGQYTCACLLGNGVLCPNGAMALTCATTSDGWPYMNCPP